MNPEWWGAKYPELYALGWILVGVVAYITGTIFVRIHTARFRKQYRAVTGQNPRCCPGDN